MPDNHFGTPGSTAPLWPPLWQPLTDDGAAPIAFYYSTTTPGTGLTHPATGANGAYISSTPVIGEAPLGLGGPATITGFPVTGVEPFYVAGGTDAGAPLTSFVRRLYAYNPSPSLTVACLLWLGGPHRWLIEPTAGVNGVVLYGDGYGPGAAGLTLTGIPVSQSTPHLLPEAGRWATDHYPGSTAYTLTDAERATPDIPPYQMGASVAQKTKPYGPSVYDRSAPVPRFAFEFALLPLHCLPFIFSGNVVSPSGSAYDSAYQFYVEIHCLRQTVVA